MSSDFWLNKMRQAQGPTPPPQAGLTAGGTPWWAHPTYVRPEQPPQQPAYGPEQMQRAYQTNRAMSSRQTELCPQCQSEHYWKPTPNTMAQCNDCGWPIQHSTSGMSAVNDTSAPSRPSTCQAKGVPFSMKNIVAHM